MSAVRLLSISVLIINLLGGSVCAERRVSEEAQVFQRLKNGVFTIFGDEGHGSGFLIHDAGVVLTNQHVIANSSKICVQINDSVKVPGKLLVADQKLDIAAIQVNTQAINDCPILGIRRNTSDFAMEGERLIAIGSPLNQTRILTSGIVSKIEEGAIISDVNINPGNSGGPLINMDEEVIAINTFGDFSPQSGPGISGSIRINLAFALIDSALSLTGEGFPPEFVLLPVMPKGIFPLWALERAVEDPKFHVKDYSLKAGSFSVTIRTPPSAYRLEKEYELKLAKKRRKREDRGKAKETERFDPYRDLKQWYQYLGEYSPVVTVMVIPKIGETTGSVWGNILGAALAGAAGTYYYGRHTYEFKADLKDATLHVNGEKVQEIQRGLTFIPLDFATATLGGSSRGEDLAKAGMLIFPCEYFSPRNGLWPSVTMKLVSIDDPERPATITVPRETIERIWFDFEPYRDCVSAKDIGLEVFE